MCAVRIYYSPIEAAIRWANVLDAQDKILEKIGSNPRPTLDQLELWPLVYLYNERIFDGIIHKELPCGKDGINCEVSWRDPDMTVRHVDLRRWILANYSYEKPCFLFSESERELVPHVDLDDLRTLLINLSLSKTNFHEQQRRFIRNHKTVSSNPDELKLRSENTYLSIIGAMLDIMVEQKRVDITNQESVINVLLTHFPKVPGLSERTLRSKFAAAKRMLSAQQ